MSAAIDKLVAMAKAHGMAGKLVPWSKAEVWTFAGTMPEDVLLAGSNDPSVDYYEQAANGPHRADTGFIDDAGKLAISFDKRKDENAQD